jgi:hypothetical protein
VEKESLQFGGFFVDFDLSGLHILYIQELVSHGRISIPQMHFVSQSAVSCGGNQLISIPPMHFVFQTAVI